MPDRLRCPTKLEKKKKSDYSHQVQPPLLLDCVGEGKENLLACTLLLVTNLEDVALPAQQRFTQVFLKAGQGLDSIRFVD